MPFSETLVHFRKLRKMSQSQLAARSGVSQQAISKLEKGISSPSEYTIRQLAAALRVSLSDLLDDEQTKKPTAEVGDGLKSDIINRIQRLEPPALDRLSDFLSGLEAGQEIAALPPAAEGSSGSPSE